MPYPCEVKVYRMDFKDGSFYIGSTKLRRLSTRMATHRYNAKKIESSKIYKKLREMGLHSFQYVLLGSIIVNNFEEQRKYEQEFVDQLQPTLNTYRAYISPEQTKAEKNERTRRWFSDPKKKRATLEKRRLDPDYKEKNKMSTRKSREKHKGTCEICDRYYTGLNRHLKTKKHLDRVALLARVV